jgi:Cu(I)/Ag(I) efflux system membrane fusion protein/cobalt-zinc-cadmium efflux system membrane fusion protein
MTRRIVLSVGVVTLVGLVALLALTDVGASLATLVRGAPPAEMPAGEMPAAHVHDPAPPAIARPAGVPRAGVALDSRRQQLIGVRTARAERMTLTPEIRAVGTVTWDETRETEINTKIDGWIRDLAADYTGKAIASGERLFTLYSPELLTAQSEYLLAVGTRVQAERNDADEALEYAVRLVQAARERLLRFDVTPQEIQELEVTRVPSDTVPFLSPVSGIIVEKTAVDGMYVTPGQKLFRVADLSRVWVEADVYERDLAAVRVGQAAAVTLDAYPGERFAGRVTYIHPSVEPQTRTVKVRLEFANPGGRLLPGMFANVELTGPAAAAIAVPADAVLDSGAEQIVFVSEGDGYFAPRRVSIGRRVAGYIEIVEGLQEGEGVATGATFFLDSESQLRAAVQGFEASPAPGATDVAPADRLDIAFRSQPDPPRSGENLFEVAVRDAAGQSVADAEVSVTLFMAAMPSMNMPAMRSDAALLHAGDGVYRGSGQVIMAGRWDVTVTVTRGGMRLGSRQLSFVAR